MGDTIKVALFGASGRTGQAVVRAGGAKGLVIRASFRDKTGAILPSTIEMLRGDLGDGDHVRDVIAGTTAVCCVFGPRPPYTDVSCARATEMIVDAMRRVTSNRRFT